MAPRAALNSCGSFCYVLAAGETAAFNTCIIDTADVITCQLRNSVLCFPRTALQSGTLSPHGVAQASEAPRRFCAQVRCPQDLGRPGAQWRCPRWRRRQAQSGSAAEERTPRAAGTALCGDTLCTTLLAIVIASKSGGIYGAAIGPRTAVAIRPRCPTTSLALTRVYHVCLLSQNECSEISMANSRETLTESHAALALLHPPCAASTTIAML